MVSGPACLWLAVLTHSRAGVPGQTPYRAIDPGSELLAAFAVMTISFADFGCMVFCRLKNILETWKAKRYCSVHKPSNHRRRLPCHPESTHTDTLPASSHGGGGGGFGGGRPGEGRDPIFLVGSC